MIIIIINYGLIITDPYLLYHCANLCHEDNENNEEDD